MRRALSLTALVVLALPAAALAASPRVRLTECDPGGRSATFTAVMRTVPRTARMQLRFHVLVRPAGGSWARVAAPATGGWHSAAAGRARYVYDQRVTGLQPGAVRVDVRFRWRAADGSVVRTASRRSAACRVPDAATRGAGPSGR